MPVKFVVAGLPRFVYPGKWSASANVLSRLLGFIFTQSANFQALYRLRLFELKAAKETNNILFGMDQQPIICSILVSCQINLALF